MNNTERDNIYRQIRSLQNSRDYAAPELEPQLTSAIQALLEIIEPPSKLDRIQRDVARIARDKRAEREALGLTVAEFDAMAERDPEEDSDGR